jgi:hypothetical protein
MFYGDVLSLLSAARIPDFVLQELISRYRSKHPTVKLCNTPISACASSVTWSKK